MTDFDEAPTTKVTRLGWARLKANRQDVLFVILFFALGVVAGNWW